MKSIILSQTSEEIGVDEKNSGNGERTKESLDVPPECEESPKAVKDPHEHGDNGEGSTNRYQKESQVNPNG